MPHFLTGEEAKVGDRVMFGNRKGTITKVLPSCQCSVQLDCTDQNHGFTMVAGTQLFKKVVNE